MDDFTIDSFDVTQVAVELATTRAWIKERGAWQVRVAHLGFAPAAA